MDRQRLGSSLVVEAGYDAFHGVLELKLSDGDIYRYFLVPQRTYDELVSAESPGRYFVSHIKERFRSELVGE